MAGADLRLPVLGAAAWAGGLLAALAVEDALAAGVCAAVGTAAAGGLTLSLGGARRLGVVAVAVVLAAVALVGVLRDQRVAQSPVATLADRRAAVTVTGTVASDPHVVHGPFGTTVMVRLTVRRVETRGSAIGLRAPVLVLGDDGWRRLPLGATVQVDGRLGPARHPDEAAVLTPRRPARVVRAPGVWWRGAAAVRASIRGAVAHRPVEQRSLVPALVDGDDADVPDALAQDFRTTGLTHLLAVSGTNLTLLVGFLVVLARWCGVRGRWLYVVGGLGIAGFVLLARTEPSVVRAAAMGAVGLLAMGANGRQRALRGLGAAVLGLMLVDPSLAASAGFALSVLATAGILLLGPPWRDALARWLPRWVAEAIAVPTAAQLACTPIVAAISGQVSLAAVGANLLAEPAVGPATVLGLAAGLLGLVWGPAGSLVGTLASWCVAWIVLVAHRGAALPAAAVGWGTGAGALVVLTLATVAIGVLGPRLVRHRALGAGCCLVLVVGAFVRLPTPGWPPAGWVLVVCDVGQGDALVLRTGPGSAVVVDAGPDPAPVRRCLDGLGIRTVPLLVLTHFHADHVDGIAGVLAGRRVEAVETTRLADPPFGVEEVDRAAAGAGLGVSRAAYGSTRQIGDVTLQVLWPLPDSPTTGPGDGSTANEASVVLLAVTHGLRLLLTGDIEPEGQVVLARQLTGLQVDVLKIPHHGSRYQDESWLLSLDPDVAIASVGADNDYGHPARETLEPLARGGAQVYRTDRDGTVAVTAHAGRPRVVTR
ncbi:competence protein ComEC [Nocardioides terrae]|uniref:Competence protein ComEC n=1 Tax=Nocardioides terrae TaxID=574651 RepID=A0A1I1D816_9ACTN|nr:ComEC/Rec2 family competence protein [Nocardioides terrae]SFB70954.1 competence protein ComEC [Nocardioides terrae]